MFITVMTLFFVVALSSCKADVALQQGPVVQKKSGSDEEETTAASSSTSSSPVATESHNAAVSNQGTAQLTVETPDDLLPNRDFRVSWNMLAEISFYSLKIGSTPGCANPTIEFDLEPTQTSQSIALPQGTYYICLSAIRTADGTNYSYADASKQIDLTDRGDAPEIIMTGPTATNNAMPTWSWSGGASPFRLKLDDSNLSVGAQETAGASFTPSESLIEGSHTLYVQDKDSNGAWRTAHSHSILVDTTRPTVAMASVVLSPTNAAEIPVTVVFSEAVTGFAATDVVVTGGTLGAFGGSGANYSFTMTPTGEGSLTVGIGAAGALDLVGNLNTAAGTPLAIVFDQTPPNSPTLAGTASPTNSPTPSWSWVSGGGGGVGTYRYKLDSSNLAVGATTVVAVTSFLPTTPLSDGDHVLTVQERDAAGNWSTSASRTISVDTVARQVAFTSAAASSNETTAGVNIPVSLSQAALFYAVTVDYAVSGSLGTATGGGGDFTLAAGTLTFAPGETSKNIVVAVVNDATDEADETVVVTLSNPTNNVTLGDTTTHTLTLTDDDGPTAAFSASTSSTEEGAGSVALGVALSAPSVQAITVAYAVTGGTATGGGTDFTLASGTLTFTAGQTSQNIAVAILNDATDEVDESVTVSISSPTNATLGGAASHTLTITDNDGPTVNFTAATSSSGEATATANLAVALSASSPQDITVAYSVSGGTATGSGTDFALVSGTLTFTAGETSKNIAVSVVNDATDELNETAIVDITTPTNASLGSTTSHTLTITDNDFVSVAFNATSSNVSEGTASVNLAVDLATSSAKTVTVNYAVTGGTATGSGTDFTLTSGALTFNPGETSKNVAVTIVNDATDEVNETVVVTLSGEANATLGANTTHTLTITDNDGPTVAFSSSSSSWSEGTAAVNLAVALSTTSAQDITVAYAVTGGTATGSGTDYTLSSGTLTYTAGESSKNIAATIVDDASFEGNETIAVTLSSPTNATLGGTTVHTYTITDNDAYIVTKEIGAGSSRHFATMQAWEDARDGVLTTRRVFTTTGQAGGAFTAGSTITGGTSGATGTYIKERTTPSSSETSMTLDLVSGTFQAGETLSSGAVSATLSAILTTAGTIEKGEMYNDAIFTGTLAVNGSTVDPSHYIWVTVAAGHRHNGLPGTGVVVSPTVAGSGITVYDPYTVIEDLEIRKVDSPGNAAGVSIAASNAVVTGTLIHSAVGAYVIGIRVFNSTDVMVKNNIVYGMSLPSLQVDTAPCSAYLYNNTAYNSTSYNISNGTNGSSECTVVIKNTLSVTNGLGCFYGTFAAASDYNLGNCGSAPGGNSLASASIDQFVSRASGVENFFPLAGAAAVNAGTALAGIFTTDMLGLTRPQGASWDIGAFEYPGFVFTDNDNTNGEFNSGSATNIVWNGTGLALKSWTATERELFSADPIIDMTGLVALWHLNETTVTEQGGSNTVADASGNGWTGSVYTGNGAANIATTGKLNSGVAAADIFDRIDVGHIPAITNVSRVTMMFWGKKATTADGVKIGKRDGGGENDDLTMQLRGGGSAASSGIGFDIGGGSADDYAECLDFAHDTNWHHVAFTFDGTQTGNNNRVKGYLDGKACPLTFYGTIPATTIANAANFYLLATDTLASGSVGTLDEVALFSRTLSAAEIAKIYQRQAGAYGGGAAGTFTSRVMTGDADTQWKFIQAQPSSPYLKELARFGDESAAYTSEGLNMSTLAGLWHLNGTVGAIANGATVLDSSPAARDGTVVDSDSTIAYQSAQFGQGITFDGANDGMTVASNLGISAYPFTFSAWVKVSSSITADGTIFALQKSTVDNIAYFVEYHWPSSQLCIEAKNTALQSKCVTVPYLTDGSWHHVAAVFASNTSKELYLDGELVGTLTTSVTLDAGIDKFSIGRNVNTATVFPLKGSFDEVAVFTTSLTANQVLSLYKRGTLSARYQVKSCAVSDCSDATFVGPDATAGTYYSELLNSSSYLPVLPLSGVAANQYFQYKMILETSNSSYTPELREVKIRAAE